MADQAGDLLDHIYTHHYEELREFKFTYPSMMEAQIRKLKHSLESWREIVLQSKRVLTWEKQWHPMALVGGNTIIFMLLWLLDPSILTTFAIFSLVLTISDYLVPSLASSVFKTEKWTSRKENEFEEFCTNVILYKAKLELAWARYYKLKTTNNKLYFIATVMCLIVMGWIGCTFNNLFLAYVFITLLLLLPGMERNGLISKWSLNFRESIVDLLKSTRPNVGQKKAD